MKKKKNQGFMLAETIIVVTVLITALMVIYLQVSNLYVSYAKRAKYDTVVGLYAAANVREFILDDGLPNIVNSLNTSKTSGIPYITIIKNVEGAVEPCPFSNEKKYCASLKASTNIKQVIFTSDGYKDFKKFNYTNDFDDSFKKYIKTINIDDSVSVSGGYRIIIEFKDSTYATLKVANS